MADRQQRGNREKRKPKADKKSASTASTSPFSSAVARQKADPGQSGKKGR
jgi:hypothetical protein